MKHPYLSNAASMREHIFDLLEANRPAEDHQEYALEVVRGLIRDLMPYALRERKVLPFSPDEEDEEIEG